MRKVFVTFGNDLFAETRDRLRKEAADSGLFDEALAYGTEDLSAEFRARHGKFMASNPRGYGFWIWKSHVIERALSRLAENDILFYADAGSSIDPTRSARLNYYIERVNAHPSGVLAFELTGIPDHRFVKMELFEAMKARQFMDASMHMATIITFRKCDAAMKFLEEWNRWCADYHLISDEPSAVPNHSDFQSTRHDQSIFSLLCKLHKVDSIRDETFGPELNSPLVASRLRPKLSRVAKLKNSLLKQRSALAWRLGLRP